MIALIHAIVIYNGNKICKVTVDIICHMQPFRRCCAFRKAFIGPTSPNINENTFSNEVLTFAKTATKKDSVYWEKIRPVPLTLEEIKDYTIKDSIKVIRKSKKYLDSLDTKRNKLGWFDPITGYTFLNSYKDWSISYNGPLLKTSFNQRTLSLGIIF